MAMAAEIGAFPLIRTKLQHPRLPGDLVPRRRLLDQLQAGLHRKVTLVSAVAGAGKDRAEGKGRYGRCQRQDRTRVHDRSSRIRTGIVNASL